MQLRDTADLKVPAARVTDLVTTESKDEVLVYDQKVHHIHHLNATAAKVWRLCDGQRTVSEIAVETGIAEDGVKLALRTLEDAQLLDAQLLVSIRGTQSRRSLIKKAAVAGIAVPAIASISAPNAAASHSPGHVCTGNNRDAGCPCNTEAKNCKGTCVAPEGANQGICQ